MRIVTLLYVHRVGIRGIFTMYSFLLTLAIGAAAGYLFFRLKIPGGMMVGSIAAISIFNITTGLAYTPSSVKVIAQIIAGAFIGVGVEKSDIARIKYIIKPAGILLLGMLFLNITTGLLIYKFSPLDLMTSLMSAVPGGMSDIPIISAEMGADASKVTVMQFLRLITGIGVFPTMIVRIAKMKAEPIEDEDEIYKREKTRADDPQFFLMTIGVATFFGVAGKLLGITAGTIVFSMVSVICLKLIYGRVCMPRFMKNIAQILAGAYIGSSVQYRDVLEMKYLVVPAIILLLGYSLACVIIGRLLHNQFNMPLKEGMLSATPAGASDMALIASDIGVLGADVVVLQIIRMIVVISIFPQIINLIVKLSGL